MQLRVGKAVPAGYSIHAASTEGVSVGLSPTRSAARTSSLVPDGVFYHSRVETPQIAHARLKNDVKSGQPIKIKFGDGVASEIVV